VHFRLRLLRRFRNNALGQDCERDRLAVPEQIAPMPVLQALFT